MSCRIVSRLWWPGGSEAVMGDVERGASHGEVAKQCHVRGVRYRLGPRESRPRRWIGGGRMHLLGEITHQTRAIGEVAAPALGVIEGLRMSVNAGPTRSDGVKRVGRLMRNHPLTGTDGAGG